MKLENFFKRFTVKNGLIPVKYFKSITVLVVEKLPNGKYFTAVYVGSSLIKYVSKLKGSIDERVRDQPSINVDHIVENSIEFIQNKKV